MTLTVLLASFAAWSPLSAADFEGPGRFCGYSAIIDLTPDETISVLSGGIHGGKFKWSGAFGELEIVAGGWNSRPRGRIRTNRAADGARLFATRRFNGQYVSTIWNGRQGVASFSSPQAFTADQRRAIERVRLFQEGEEPSNCHFRVAFSWDF